MTLTFVDTHNMVAYLNKSDASEGFNQIINFLNGSYIAYALTFNPTIYVSCIKQLWNTVAVKQSNDITRLQALVDKKRLVVTEATIRDALHLDDAEGVDCLPNEDIFTTLARMGYEKPSTKLTFYKAFFLSWWKFLIHTILQSMSAKHTSWNEFSSAMASAVICLSTGDLLTHSTKYISPALTQKGDAEEQGHDDNVAKEPVTAVDDVEDQTIHSPTPLTPPPQQPQNIPSTSQVQLPPPQQQSPPPAQPQGVYFPMSLLQEALDAYDTIMKDVSNQGRMLDESDKDEGVELMNENEEKETEEVRVNPDDAQVEGRHADIYHIDMDHATKVLTDVPAALVNAAAVVTTAAPVKVDVLSTRQRRGVVIRDPEEETSAKTPTETKSKDKGKCIMVKEPKSMKKKQQVELDEAYARKLQEELNQDID
nr:hypothetical protein [Tanacetum cinerariifolium]